MKMKIKEGLYLVRQAQPRFHEKTEYDFVIWIEPSYNGYRIQIRDEPANDFSKGLIPFSQKAEMVKKGHRPAGGNALPVVFTLMDAKKVAASIANSKLFTS